MEINYYNILKSLHIIFFTTWMAGLFYLPRLFVYHTKISKKDKNYQTFIIMERKLMRYIMNPSMILTWVFGVLLTYEISVYDQLWLNLKFVFVFLLSVFHMYCARIRKNFEGGKNDKTESFYRWVNEVPTTLFIIIVFLVVFKPN